MRKESISNSSSSSNNASYNSKSRIPVPNVVKDLVKRTDSTPLQDEGLLSPISRNQQVQYNKLTDKDIFEYENTNRSTRRFRDPVHDMPQHLEPSIADYSTDDFLEENQQNLVVNLEDLVIEENCLNTISEALHRKRSMQQICQKWWKATNISSVKEMQVFFEEALSKKLIKSHQIIL